MDELSKKVEELLKSLLSLKSEAKKDFFVPAIKSPALPKPSIKNPGKIPGGLPPPSKKDPKKVAEQLKNPRPGKVNVEILKVEDNGQWTLSKGFEEKSGSVTAKIGGIPPTVKATRAPVHAQNEGFVNHHSPEQKGLIHGLDIHNMAPLRGGLAGGGSHTATNLNNGKTAVVKRAGAHANQAERGHLDNGFNSAKREVLFHNMARDYFGMGKHVPTTAGFSRDGEDYSAQEFLPNARHPDFKSVDKPLEGKDENPFESKPEMEEFKHSNHTKVLNNLHESGDLHKLALMDNIMGHHDRHSGNLMMDEKEDKLHLIDNGTAFDYGNFDSRHHYPAYLRHSENKNIKGMGKDNATIHPEAAKWLNKLNPEEAKKIFAAHGHDESSPVTQGFLRRLQGMKNTLNNGPEHYKNLNNVLDKNRLTTGPLYPHKAEDIKW